MASDKVLAVWNGPPSVANIGGADVPLQAGVTVCEIGKDEAEQSDNWKPLTKKQAAAHRGDAFTDDGDDA